MLRTMLIQKWYLTDQFHVPQKKPLYFLHNGVIRFWWQEDQGVDISICILADRFYILDKEPTLLLQMEILLFSLIYFWLLASYWLNGAFI